LNLCWIARQWPKEFHRPKRPSKLDAREYRSSPTSLQYRLLFQWNNNNNNNSNNRAFCHTFSKRDLWGVLYIYLLLYIQQLRIYSGQLSIEYSIAQSIYLDTFTTNKKKENLFLLYIFWFEVFKKKKRRY
jgi:hypothetical protein